MASVNCEHIAMWSGDQELLVASLTEKTYCLTCTVRLAQSAVHADLCLLLALT